MERKQRIQMIKKNLEYTIEVEKHSKIKRNLDNLDQFVKKHMRQKSTPIMNQKKPSIVGGQLQVNISTKPKKQHKKNKQTQQIVGLSEIFYPGLTKDSHDLSAAFDTAKADSTAEVIKSQRNKKHMSNNSSLIIDTRMYSLNRPKTAKRTKSKDKKGSRPK